MVTAGPYLWLHGRMGWVAGVEMEEREWKKIGRG